VFRIAPIDESVLPDALDHEGSDFEDAVTAAAARISKCDAIVTHDPKGFRATELPVLTPEAAAPLLT
jgi:predicted nucleic acid-binding protein